MEAKREGDNIVVTFTMEEAHVLIWGGPTDVCDDLKFELRHRMVDVEDNDFTDAEYRERIDPVGRPNELYEKLRETTGEFHRKRVEEVVN